MEGFCRKIGSPDSDLWKEEVIEPLTAIVKRLPDVEPALVSHIIYLIPLSAAH
jgi:hypothetical protein